MPFIKTPFITSGDGHAFAPIAGRGLGFVEAGPANFIIQEASEDGGFIVLEDNSGIIGLEN